MGSASRWWPRCCATTISCALPLLALGFVAARRWQQSGPYVSGLDAGTWLAYGRGLLGGEGRATDGVYPPLVPLVIGALRVVVGPLDAARLVAVGSLLAVGVAVWWVARGELRWWCALAAALLALTAGPITETWAFGGYPQNLATALLLLACAATARYLRCGGRRTLALAALWLALTALTHHLYAVVVGLALLTVAALWLTLRPEPAERVRRLGGFALIAAVGLLAFLPTAIGLVASGFSPAGLGTRASESGASAGATVLLVGLIGAALLVLTLTVEQRAAVVWSAAAALIGPALVLALGFGQLRLLPLVVVGASLLVGLVLDRCAAWAAGGRWRWLPVALAAALLLTLVRADEARTRALLREYRVLDSSFLDAITALDSQPTDGRIAVAPDRRGWPIGWWVEGLRGGRLLVGGDRAYLAYPEERANALLVDRLVRDRPSAAEAAAWAEQHGISLLLLSKAEWEVWQRWDVEPDPAVRVVYDQGRYLIVAFERAAPGG